MIKLKIIKMIFRRCLNFKDVYIIIEREDEKIECC